MKAATALPSQRAALLSCADAGELRRTRDGYAGNCPSAFHTTRTVKALVREGLLQFVDGAGETRLVPTPLGWCTANAMAHEIAQAAQPKAAAA